MGMSILEVETVSKTDLAAMARISPIEIGLIRAGKRWQKALLFLALPFGFTALVPWAFQSEMF